MSKDNILDDIVEGWWEESQKQAGRFGDYLVSWFPKYTGRSEWVDEMQSERFTGVTEDYVDGFIYALQLHDIARAKPVKQKLG